MLSCWLTAEFAGCFEDALLSKFIKVSNSVQFWQESTKLTISKCFQRLRTGRELRLQTEHVFMWITKCKSFRMEFIIINSVKTKFGKLKIQMGTIFQIMQFIIYESYGSDSLMMNLVRKWPRQTIGEPLMNHKRWATSYGPRVMKRWIMKHKKWIIADDHCRWITDQIGRLDRSTLKVQKCRKCDVKI